MGIEERIATVGFEGMDNTELDTVLSTIYNIKNARREALRSLLVKKLEKAWNDIEDAGYDIELDDGYDDYSHPLHFEELCISD